MFTRSSKRVQSPSPAGQALLQGAVCKPRRGEPILPIKAKALHDKLLRPEAGFGKHDTTVQVPAMAAQSKFQEVAFSTAPSSPQHSALSSLSSSSLFKSGEISSCDLTNPNEDSLLPPPIAKVALPHEIISPPVGRHDQFQKLEAALSVRLSRAGGCRRAGVYVSGTPGTGKTHTVKTVLASLRQTSSNFKECPQVFLNCACVSSASALLTGLVDRLNLSMDYRTNAVETLRSFATSSGAAALVVVDELDLLVTGGAGALSSLYTLFELSALESSRLCVVAIANAVDLGTRLLPLLHGTCAMPEAIPFPAYDAHTLQDIARKVVHGSDNVPPVVLALAAKKAAAAGGDARFVAEVVRQAVGHVQMHGAAGAAGVVASAAAAKGASSNAMVTIQGLPVVQKVALVVAANAAVWNESRPNTGKGKLVAEKRATLGGLYESFQRMCERLLISSLPFADFVDFCSGALVHHGLLDVASQSRKGGRGKSSKTTCVYGQGSVASAKNLVRLRVSVRDVRDGVSDVPMLDKLVCQER